ncbi:unnamed protein product [Trichobilharzia regenti]|nr:unnamed protein product [Trichobilharzia regenti]
MPREYMHTVALPLEPELRKDFPFVHKEQCLVLGIPTELVIVDLNIEHVEAEISDLQNARQFLPNVAIYGGSTIIPHIVENSPKCIIIVAVKPGNKQNIDQSNIVDVLAYVTWRISGFPTNRVLGVGTMLDSSRFCNAISKKLGLSADSVSGYILGEQGEKSANAHDRTDTCVVPYQGFWNILATVAKGNEWDEPILATANYRASVHEGASLLSQLDIRLRLKKWILYSNLHIDLRSVSAFTGLLVRVRSNCRCMGEYEIETPGVFDWIMMVLNHVLENIAENYTDRSQEVAVNSQKSNGYERDVLLSRKHSSFSWYHGLQGIDKDIFFSLPCIVNANGVRGIMLQQLDEDEKEKLFTSAKKMEELLQSIEW